MAMVGVTPETAVNAITGIKNAYSELINVLTTSVETNYVGKIAEAWGSPAAVKIMGAFKSDLDSQIRGITTTFGSIVSTMNAAAKALLEQQQYTGWVDIRFSPNERANVNVSSVQESLGGSIEADHSLVETANATLTGTITQEVNTALSHAKSAVSNSGFIGGGMQESLVSSLSSIQSSINNAFSKVAGEISKTSATSTSNLEEGATTIASDNFTVSE